MKRVVVYYDTLFELLQNLLYGEREVDTLIICSTEKQFLEQLIESVSAHQLEQATAFEKAALDDHSQQDQPHPLLVPTLQLLSKSKRTKLAFCPTIDTLRAFLSGFAAQSWGTPDRSRTLLIQDLILLHHGTSEFSVQGLMRSLALGVETAARNHMDLHLCECKDVYDLSNPDRGPTLWDAEIPLLSGSVRLRGENTGWSQRVISVRSIAGRWFKFEKEQRQEDVESNGDEEMLV